MLVMLTIRMYECRKIILNTNISSRKVNVHPGDHRVDISRVDINLRDNKRQNIYFRSLNIIKEILIKFCSN